MLMMGQFHRCLYELLPEIAFSPKSQIGAAEAVSGGGSIDSSYEKKDQFLSKAKIRIMPEITDTVRRSWQP